MRDLINIVHLVWDQVTDRRLNEMLYPSHVEFMIWLHLVPSLFAHAHRARPYAMINVVLGPSNYGMFLR